MVIEKCYWVAEVIHENDGKKQIMYWTGNIPHLSIQQSEAGLDLWTIDIHKAKKFETKEQCEISNEEFQIFGEVKEHMDRSFPYKYPVTIKD